MNNEQKKPKTGKVYTPEALLNAKASFCQLLRSRRLELGLTPQQVSEDLSLNLPQVYKDEGNSNNITLLRLLKYMHYYGITFKA